jgi:hypothetical protein
VPKVFNDFEVFVLVPTSNSQLSNYNAMANVSNLLVGHELIRHRHSSCRGFDQPRGRSDGRDRGRGPAAVPGSVLGEVGRDARVRRRPADIEELCRAEWEAHVQHWRAWPRWSS